MVNGLLHTGTLVKFKQLIRFLEYLIGGVITMQQSGCDPMRWDIEFNLDQWSEKMLHVQLCVCTAKAKHYKQSSGYPEPPNFLLASGKWEWMETMGNEQRKRHRMKTRMRETKKDFPCLLKLSCCCGKWRGGYWWAIRKVCVGIPNIIWFLLKSSIYTALYCEPHDNAITGTDCLWCWGWHAAKHAHWYLLNTYIIPTPKTKQTNKQKSLALCLIISKWLPCYMDLENLEMNIYLESNPMKNTCRSFNYYYCSVFYASVNCSSTKEGDTVSRTIYSVYLLLIFFFLK